MKTVRPEFEWEERVSHMVFWLVIGMIVFLILSACGACFWVMWILTKLVTHG